MFLPAWGTSSGSSDHMTTYRFHLGMSWVLCKVAPRGCLRSEYVDNPSSNCNAIGLIDILMLMITHLLPNLQPWPPFRGLSIYPIIM